MRSSALYSIAFLLSSAIPTTSEHLPFLSPYFEPSFDSIADTQNELKKRQNNCPSGANPCSNLGNPGACCTSNTDCQLDQAGHVACCPNGASCTGTINAGTVSAILGGNTASLTQVTASSTNGFIVPASTTQANPQLTAAGGSGVSTVPNAFFPFVYLPATYSNAAACSSYYSSCQSEYASCTASLGGGVNGVTVSGAGVGITVQGSTPTAQPQSVCSSLSSQACSGLQLSNCNSYETAGAATVTVINPNAAPNRCPGGLYGVGMGVALGVAGQVLV